MEIAKTQPKEANVVVVSTREPHLNEINPFASVCQDEETRMLSRSQSFSLENGQTFWTGTSSNRLSTKKVVGSRVLYIRTSFMCPSPLQ